MHPTVLQSDSKPRMGKQIFTVMVKKIGIKQKNQFQERTMTMVKTIGEKGQIELGNEYAGQDALIDQIEPGVWIIKLGQFIPHSERWLHQKNVKSEIDRAVAWAEKNPPKPSDLDQLEILIDKQKEINEYTARPE